MNDENKAKENIKILEIPVSDISPNPHQPRLSFDNSNLSSLADSIQKYGVMQPIVVTEKEDNKFELISGERRLRASKMAGIETIPAVVRRHEHSDEEKFELAIIENVQREDLNPIDKAKAFKKLTEEFGYTHSQIAQKLGKSREYISNSLRLLALPDTILEAIARGAITEGHSKPLLMLNDKPLEQQELLKRIITNGLTVRAAIASVRSLTELKNKKKRNSLDPELKRMEKKLEEKLGTNVHIDPKEESEGGKLTIEYFSKEDLDKIINLVRGKGLSGIPLVNNDYDDLKDFKNNFSDDNIKKEKNNSEVNNFSKEIDLLNKQENQKNQEESALDGFDITSFALEKSFKNLNELKNNQEENNFNNEKEIVVDEKVKDLENYTNEKMREKNILEGLEEKDKAIKNFSIDFSDEKKNLKNSYSEEKINNFDLDSDEEENKEEKYNQENKINESFSENLKSESYSEEGDRNESPAKTLEKTDEQKRVDSILAGKSSVLKEYSSENIPKNNISLEVPKNQKEIEILEEKKEDIEKSSIYQEFLKSKKRIEEQKKAVFMPNKEVGQNSEETSSFLNSQIKNSQENKLNSFNNMSKSVNENENGFLNKKSENSETENLGSVENVFNGDEFIPKDDGLEDLNIKNDKLNQNLNSNFQSGSNNSGRISSSNFGNFSI